ncbi:MAG: hypothetical protein ACREE4_17220 [Stellaceae bacterium]
MSDPILSDYLNKIARSGWSAGRSGFVAVEPGIAECRGEVQDRCGSVAGACPVWVAPPTATVPAGFEGGASRAGATFS